MSEVGKKSPCERNNDIANSDMSLPNIKERLEDSNETPACDKSKESDTFEKVDCQSDGEVLSPDFSESPQTTLRYSDTEPEPKVHDKSHESSSDSIETLEDIPSEDSHIEISQAYFQQLSFIQNSSKDSSDSAERNNNELDNRPYQSDGNTSSDSHEVIPDLNSIPRPESLSIPNLSLNDRNRSQSDGSNSCKHSEDKSGILSLGPGPVLAEDQSMHSSKTGSTSGAQGLPQGTIIRQGDMIQFVADDLTQKIKLSSPKSHTDSDSLDSRRSSVRSIVSASSSTSAATSSGKSRSPSYQWQQSPDDIPPIDVAAVAELEVRARRVADSVDLMMGNIRNNLHKMSAITIGCQEAYKRSVDITCDSVDGSIKAMYAMMAKCEELSTSMKPVEQLATQIKEIKRILELFETQLNDK